MIGQIQTEGGDRDEVLFDRPTIRADLGGVEGASDEPIDLSIVGVARAFDVAVVVPDRLAREYDAAWALRKIHVHERKLRELDQARDHGFDVGTNRRVTCIVPLLGRTEGDAADAEERCLLGGGEGSRVPHRVANVEPEVHPREHDIDITPDIGAEADAIRGSPVDAKRL